VIPLLCVCATIYCFRLDSLPRAIPSRTRLPGPWSILFSTPFNDRGLRSIYWFRRGDSLPLFHMSCYAYWTRRRILPRKETKRKGVQRWRTVVRVKPVHTQRRRCKTHSGQRTAKKIPYVPLSRTYISISIYIYNIYVHTVCVPIRVL